MIVVTYATDRNHPALLRFLAPSCARFGLDLVVLPPRPPRKLRTFRMKDRWLLRFLRGVPEDEIVFSTDGYDAFLLAGPEEIVAKYRAFGRPLVFSAEQNCWPRPALAARYPPSPTPARFLNTGGFVGTAGAILRAVRGVRWQLTALRIPWSNQYRWTLWYLKHQDMIALDHGCRLFYCASARGSELRLDRWPSKEAAYADPAFRRERIERFRAEVEVEEGRVRYLATGERPCHIHFNGATAHMMDDPFFRPLRAWEP